MRSEDPSDGRPEDDSSRDPDGLPPDGSDGPVLKESDGAPPDESERPPRKEPDGAREKAGEADGPGSGDDAGARAGGGTGPKDGTAPSSEASGLRAGGAEGAMVVKTVLPETMFVFPLRGAVPFPNLMMPVLLDSAAARDVVAKAEAHNGHLLLVAQRNPDKEQPGPDDLRPVGVVARILKTIHLPDGNMSSMTQGLRRARIARVVRTNPHIVARVTEIVEIPSQGKRAESMFRLLQQKLGRLGELHGQADPGFAMTILNLDNPGALADFAGTVLRRVDDRQRLLEEADVEKRLELALELVMGELELAELDQRIQSEIRAKTEKAQKEYFLREQLKIIRRELGEEKDPRLQELQRLEEAIANAAMPEAASARAREELTRLKTTPVESAEYGVIRNYLDWLTGLPWSKSSEDLSDIRKAQAILEEDHYGLQEVKDRILEFLAVRKLKPGHQGSILCFAGPPGVGKTSLGRSIARAMGRRFWRFSLGGMRDEAEIKGHRRTYVGAMPGRVMQGLKTCGTNNPVLMLDEIDKLGSDFRGDPSSSLLEVLDPEQNHAFLDHYLDVPFDLSKVMFLATANALPQIPPPLRDRMEIIELPGYLLEEKVQIASRHLLPRQLERHGLHSRQLSIPLPVLRRLTQRYTREAGVRGLDKVLQRLCRKTALAVAKRAKPPGRLTVKGLEKMLGRPKFQPGERRRASVPGVIQGLAWTPVGGDVLYVEVTGSKGKGTLQLTGCLGDVMAESARLALSFLKSRADAYGIDLAALGSTDLHLHFPAGAIPKDGPSAGIAIACAFLGYLTREKAPIDLAMTGELTAVGAVLPIGGVREKVIAAKTLGIRRVVLPRGNEADIAEMKKDMVEGLDFLYVETFDEVAAIVYPRRDGARGRPGARARDRRPAKPEGQGGRGG
ncbi:MAG: endopeptidase La [Planctomycetota bacterium]